MSGRGAAYPQAFALRLDDAKVMHCIRHAEGQHNVAARDRGPVAYTDRTLVDAVLTERGEAQALEAGRSIRALGLPIDLIVVSPLRRTLQTATLAFGTDIPMLACELCREAHGLHWSDKRRPIRENRREFPHVDFSRIESDEDIYWREDRRELVSEVITRARKFVTFLAGLRERNIVVVSHGVFLEMLLGPDVLGAVEPTIMVRRFSNCERRSVIVGAWSPQLRDNMLKPLDGEAHALAAGRGHVGDALRSDAGLGPSPGTVAAGGGGGSGGGGGGGGGAAAGGGGDAASVASTGTKRSTESGSTASGGRRIVADGLGEISSPGGGGGGPLEAKEGSGSLKSIKSTSTSSSSSTSGPSSPPRGGGAQSPWSWRGFGRTRPTSSAGKAVLDSQ